MANKRREPGEREACLGSPRDLKQPGSVEWCWQTLYLLKIRWERKTWTDKEWDALMQEIREQRVWDTVPPAQPYGSLHALLDAEIGPGAAQACGAVVPGGTTPSTARQLGLAVGGKRAALAYACYDYLNSQYFAGQVPVPLVIWTPTPYGGCIGMCHPTTPPLIRLNPTLLKKQDGRVRGVANTCDTVLHEMMHAYIHHVLGGWQGRGQESSHNNDLWVSECNRIAPLLGLQLVAARNKVRRVPIEDAPPTKSGKQPTRAERLTTGTVPFAAIARFPQGARVYLGQEEWFQRDLLPFAHPYDGVHGDSAVVEDHSTITG